MNKEESNVTDAFRKARNQQVENIKKSFKNSNAEGEKEIDENEVVEKEDDEEETEEVKKANEADFINNGLDNGILEIDHSIMKAVYSDTEVNRTLGIVGDVVDLNKSDVMNAISGYESKITLNKSGKELKEQVKNIVLPEKNRCKETCEKEAKDLLEECGAAPTRDVDKWWTNDMDIEVPFKIYSWDETYVPERGVGIAETLSPSDNKELNAPGSQKVAELRRKYNDKVRNVCDALVDIKACEILLNNVEDKQKFELTPRQIIAFKFR